MSLASRSVLKENEIFLVSELAGDISSRNSDGHGLYWRDTRFLSLYELSIEGFQPTLLSSASEYNFINTLQFANSAFSTAGGVQVAARTISIRRNRFIEDGLRERVGLFNYNRFEVDLCVKVRLGSDFRDMFDVRGYTTRPVHGAIESPHREADRIVLSYVGLDGVKRSTRVQFDPPPSEVSIDQIQGPLVLEPQVLPGISGSGDQRTDWSVTPPTATALFRLRIPPQSHRTVTIHVLPEIHGQRPVGQDDAVPLDSAFVQIRDSYRGWDAESTVIQTDHEILNRVIRRASHDLRLLCDQTDGGFVPSAGIPWFCVPFGRDGLITAIQTLMFQPAIAYGTLRFLAANQGQRIDDWRDEEPGKILHEVRLGEVAALHEVPHTQYFGSVDSTPLFLVALGELLDWTDDQELAKELRPNVEAALDWIDQYGDLDGDGYVEYKSRSSDGIRNQGWKDSRDAISYPDGTPVDPPIALAEVQGYVFDARQRMARYYRRLGDEPRASVLEGRAQQLQERFLRDFWVADRDFWAMALGPDKRPLSVVGSNAGHCVWSGLLQGDSGRRAAHRLLAEDMNSGWGIRTLSSDEPIFNPMSYHNGSVWPHDNSLIGAGVKRVGLDDDASRLISAVLEAAMRFPDYRMPELYCGFNRDRRYFSIPAQYPVSCSPQAWAAGSVFLMLQTMLGLRVDAARGRVTLRPRLVDWITRLLIRRLRVGDRRLTFELRREGGLTHVDVSDSGGLEILVEQAAG